MSQRNNKNLLLAQEWFLRAGDDELSAKSILKNKDGSPNTVCFLSQQIAEKFLKGFLVFKGVRFSKIHQLDRLVALCGEIDNQFENIKKEAEYLPQAIVRPEVTVNPEIKVKKGGRKEERLPLDEYERKILTAECKSILEIANEVRISPKLLEVRILEIANVLGILPRLVEARIMRSIPAKYEVETFKEAKKIFDEEEKVTVA